VADVEVLAPPDAEAVADGEALAPPDVKTVASVVEVHFKRVDAVGYGLHRSVGHGPHRSAIRTFAASDGENHLLRVTKDYVNKHVQ
ncbi:hypothetical protein LSAT2_016112, partial [Lamellibrachia satsuma]